MEIYQTSEEKMCLLDMPSRMEFHLSDKIFSNLLKWEIHNGKQTLFWEDSWLRDQRLKT